VGLEESLAAAADAAESGDPQRVASIAAALGDDVPEAVRLRVSEILADAVSAQARHRARAEDDITVAEMRAEMARTHYHAGRLQQAAACMEQAARAATSAALLLRRETDR